MTFALYDCKYQPHLYNVLHISSVLICLFKTMIKLQAVKLKYHTTIVYLTKILFI